MDNWRIIEYPRLDEDQISRWMAMASKPPLTLKELIFELETAEAPFEPYKQSPNERRVTATLHLVGYAGEDGSVAVQRHWDQQWSGTARFEVLKDHEVAAAAARVLAEEKAIKVALEEAERDLFPPAAIVS